MTGQAAVRGKTTATDHSSTPSGGSRRRPNPPPRAIHLAHAKNGGHIPTAVASRLAHSFSKPTICFGLPNSAQNVPDGTRNCKPKGMYPHTKTEPPLPPKNCSPPSDSSEQHSYKPKNSPARQKQTRRRRPRDSLHPTPEGLLADEPTAALDKRIRPPSHRVFRNRGVTGDCELAIVTTTKPGILRRSRSAFVKMRFQATSPPRHEPRRSRLLGQNAAPLRDLSPLVSDSGHIDHDSLRKNEKTGKNTAPATDPNSVHLQANRRRFRVLLTDSKRTKFSRSAARRCTDSDPCQFSVNSQEFTRSGPAQPKADFSSRRKPPCSPANTHGNAHVRRHTRHGHYQPSDDHKTVPPKIKGAGAQKSLEEEVRAAFSPN